MNWLFLSIFVGLGIFYMILGLYVSKDIKNKEDYFLAGRKLGLFPLTFTLIATQVGGGMMLGTAAKSYEVGYFGIFYTLGMSIGFLFLGLGLASKLRSFNIATTAELFETKYNSITLRKIASSLSIITLFGILGAQVVGLRSLLYALDLNNEFIFLAFWLFIIIYTMVGGLKAVSITDTLQILFLFVVFSILFIFSLLKEPSSFFTLKSFCNNQNAFSGKSLTFLTLFPMIFNPMMFSFIEQDLAQRFFSAKSKKTAALGATFAAVFMLLFSFVPVYFGMKAKLNGLALIPGASPLVTTLSNIASNFLLSLVVCALAAAITSTADSLLCAISSNICQDFDLSFLPIKNNLKRSQLITFIVGTLAVIVAYFSNDIIGILIQSYELSICCLFVPIFLCYFKKKLVTRAATFSIVFGFLGFLFFRFYTPPFPKELITIAISFGGYLLGEFFEDKFVKLNKNN